MTGSTFYVTLKLHDSKALKAENVTFFMTPLIKESKPLNFLSWGNTNTYHEIKHLEEHKACPEGPWNFSLPH